ncbi:MAG: cation:proton antiporter [Deltaproteobacteria bacterium]|nr:cation:proton antiporter [Deltaproteobacteria bacterium]
MGAVLLTAPDVVSLVGGASALLLLASGTWTLCSRLRVPFPVALVLLGMGVAQVAQQCSLPVPALGREISREVVTFLLLPTLVFQSALHLEARQLRHNLIPILILAVPGLLLSAAMVGAVVWLTTSMSLPLALLLGSILSAIDHVAVSAVFKQIRAPRRLMVLVEGESLFSEVTAVVAAHVLLGVVLGRFSSATIVPGVLEFLSKFLFLSLGGILVGTTAALAAGFVLGHVDDSPFVEISVATCLAYVSFLIAEHVLEMSGVMATAAAALITGTWGHSKISGSVRDQLEGIWKYLDFLAVSLIFLLVGLEIDLYALAGALDSLPWVIGAVVLSRGAVVFGLVPLIGRLPKSDPIDRRHQTIMFWGGLRGAVPIALVLSLGEQPPALEGLLPIVVGVSLATLVAPGLSMRRLVQRLGLSRPTLPERVARAEALLLSKARALEHLPELCTGGLFSGPLSTDLESAIRRGLEEARADLAALRQEELDPLTEQQLTFLRCLEQERALYGRLFHMGHISEKGYRGLEHSVQLQSDRLRYHGCLPAHTAHPPDGHLWDRFPVWLRARVPRLSTLAEWVQRSRAARQYEECWARHQASTQVLARLDELTACSSGACLATGVRDKYERWNVAARQRLDDVAEQFPEFVTAMQRRLAERLVAHAERQAIESGQQTGIVPRNTAETLLGELRARVRRLRGLETRTLRADPSELLQKVPFFQGIPHEDFEKIAQRLQPRTVPAGETIIQEGESTDSLYLVARGVVRVSRVESGAERDVATMMAGDFFGEMGLLHGEPRSATCRAATPCALYELTRTDFDTVRLACAAIHGALVEAETRRMEERRLRMGSLGGDLNPAQTALR